MHSGCDREWEGRAPFVSHVRSINLCQCYKERNAETRKPLEQEVCSSERQEENASCIGYIHGLRHEISRSRRTA